MSALFELKSAQGQRISINSDQVRVGRAADNNVVLKDAKVSRYHVNFYITNGNLIVEDAGSQNGFLVNGTQGTGAMILKTGDRIFFGSNEYLVQKIGENLKGPSTPPPNSARIVMGDGGFSSKPQTNPRKLILIAAVVGIFGYIIHSETQTKVVAEAPKELDVIEAPLNLDEPGSKHVLKSPTEITAEGKFREGMRDFYNGNYTQAKLSFDEAITTDPSQQSAQDYLVKTNNAIQQQVTALIKAATTSYSNLQYQRARAEAFAALSVISEEVPGWSRKLASEDANELKDERKDGQEDILLSFQCDRTERKKECNDALNIIKSCRQKLGVEDALK